MDRNLDWTTGTGLHGAGWALAALFAFWLVVVEPLLGRAAFRHFLRTLARGDAGARLRFYRRWTLQGWLLMAVILVLVFGVFGWTPAQIGLRAPHFPPQLPWGFLSLLVVAAFAGLILGIVMARRRPPRATPGKQAGPAPEVMRMLPRSAAERHAFAMLAVTAGITEEVIWRGVLLAMLVAVAPGLPTLVLGAAMAVVFGWAHLYQGPGGVIGTTILGGLLTALYLASGSLLLPMLLHAAIDLLAMLRSPDRPDQAT